MTLSPGHPLPRLAHLSLAIATILRNGADGPPRFAEVDLPRDAAALLHGGGDADARRRRARGDRPREPRPALSRTRRRAGVSSSESRAARSSSSTSRAPMICSTKCRAPRRSAVKAPRSAWRSSAECPRCCGRCCSRTCVASAVGDDTLFVTDVEEAAGLIDLRGLVAARCCRRCRRSDYPQLACAQPFRRSERDVR